MSALVADWTFPDLRRFFAPSSVAYIGATEDLAKFGGRCVRELIDFGFAGAIYPVNPKRREIFGLRCYATLGDLPEVPDHVGIVLPAPAIPEALAQCGRAGVPFATVFSAGFTETGSAEGRALQARIAATARQWGVRMMGPNCNGMVNFVDRVAMTSTAVIRGARRPAGDVAVASHSGGAGQVNVMWRAQQAGLEISYQVSCGNDADLDLLDYMAFMVEDEQTRVVLALAETISNGAKLRAVAARAAALDKAIVMVKVGRSAAGSRAAASHTGAVTGADDVCSAALEQFGIVRVDDCHELYEAAMLLRRRQRIRGRRAAATSISGGNLVMVTDLGAGLGVEWPPYAASTQQTLGALLPGFSAAANPTDLTAAAVGRADVFTQVCRVLHDDPNIDVVLPVLTFAPAADIRSLTTFAAAATKPVALLWTGKCLDDPTLTPERLVSEGHAVFRDAQPAMKALWAAMRHHEARQKRTAAAPLRRPQGVDTDAAHRILAAAVGPMDEQASKQLLALYGLPVTREQLARDAREALHIARAMGAPVALKILSPDIPHKTEAGAIRLGVQGDDAVASAFEEVMAAARNWRPDARIEGVLIQEMVSGGEEVLLGISTDPVFGPVVTVGLGGIFVEVMQDLALRLAPVAHDEAHAMLASLRSYPVLNGARGRAVADLDALADCIVRVSWLAADMRGVLAELDINPLRVLPRGQGVRVVDALAIPAPRKAAT